MFELCSNRTDIAEESDREVTSSCKENAVFGLLSRTRSLVTMECILSSLFSFLRPMLNIFSDYDDDDNYDEDGIDGMYIVLGFFVLGIWLVFKRYESIRNRAVDIHMRVLEVVFILPIKHY